MRRDLNKAMDRRIISDRRLEALLGNIGAHPYLLAAFACFGLTAFGYDSQKFINGFTVYFALALIVGRFFLKLLKGLNDSSKNSAAVWMSFWGKSLIAFAAAVYFVNTERKAQFVCFAGIALTLILYIVLLNNDRKFYDKIKCLVLAAAGFVLRFSYVLETDIYTRQNDVWLFGGEGGHAGYIEYICNHRALPDFDPTTLWQYYHPPLHHIICAVWLKFCSMFGIEYYMACEALQSLSMFYICAVLITLYRLLRLFGLKGKALTVPFGIASAYPYLAMMSGAINNDPLMLCFLMGALYCAVRWYREQTAKNIVKLALCIGLGMMTKLSVGLIAPAVAAVFIIALIKEALNKSDPPRSDAEAHAAEADAHRLGRRILKNKKRILNRLGQLCLFGAVCCPLGLWWSVRNLIRFNVKPTYIPMLSETDGQYIGEIPLIKRFTDFSLSQFESVFEQWGGESYKEYNPTVALLKNSMFGEGINESHFPEQALIIPRLLFWTAAILAAFSFVIMLVMLFKKTEGASFAEKLLLTASHLTILVNYYIFCARYKFICTMNFRYIVPCMLIGLINIGLFMQTCQKTEKAKAGELALKILGFLSSAFIALAYAAVFFVIASNG